MMATVTPVFRLMMGGYGSPAPFRHCRSRPGRPTSARSALSRPRWRKGAGFGQTCSSEEEGQVGVAHQGRRRHAAPVALGDRPLVPCRNWRRSWSALALIHSARSVTRTAHPGRTLLAPTPRQRFGRVPGVLPVLIACAWVPRVSRSTLLVIALVGFQAQPTATVHRSGDPVRVSDSTVERAELWDHYWAELCWIRQCRSRSAMPCRRSWCYAAGTGWRSPDRHADRVCTAAIATLTSHRNIRTSSPRSWSVSAVTARPITSSASG